MRVKRLHYYRKLRQRKAKNLLLYAFLIPCLAVFMGYVIASVVIFPNIK